MTFADWFKTEGVEIAKSKPLHEAMQAAWEAAACRKTSGRKPSPICIRGVTFSSAKEAAETHGVHVSTIYASARKGTLDDLGRSNRVPNRPTTIYGKTYPSRKAAADALGYTPGDFYTLYRNGFFDRPFANASE